MIDVINFTPYSSLIGGLIIGVAVVLFFITTGRLAGISGIVSSTLEKNENKFSNLLFIIGLVLGPLVFIFFSQNDVVFKMTSSIPLIIVGGLLVGLGTKIGRGCTSGHGICGISRFSMRSILATIIFMIFAMFTVFFLQLLEIYKMYKNIFSLISGLVFGIGLTIGGMTNPSKVIAFLNITNNWDPSLIFVMGGAIAFVLPSFYLLKNKEKPIFASSFQIPSSKNINQKLILGSSMFGIGWGMIGLCPGPAISSIAFLQPLSILFIISMMSGFYLTKFIKI